LAFVKQDPADAWMEDKGFEKMMRKFKKKVEDQGILKELRDRESYRAPSLKRKLKREEAEKRRRIAERKRMRFYTRED